MNGIKKFIQKVEVFSKWGAVVGVFFRSVNFFVTEMKKELGEEND